jgi:hypothetical protein
MNQEPEGPVLALAPQVLTEFIHVVTDPRRFSRPLAMVEAVERAQHWWEAREVRPMLPGVDATRLGEGVQVDHGWYQRKPLHGDLPCRGRLMPSQSGIRPGCRHPGPGFVLPSARIRAGSSPSEFIQIQLKFK